MPTASCRNSSARSLMSWVAHTLAAIPQFHIPLQFAVAIVPFRCERTCTNTLTATAIMAKDLPQLNRIKSQSKAQLVIALQSLLL